MARGIPVVALLAATLCGCSEQDLPAGALSDAADPVIASHDGGTITMAALDAAILSLDPSERARFRADSLEVYVALAEDLLTNALIADEVERQNVAKWADVSSEIESMRRRALVDEALRTVNLEMELPTEADVAQRYQERIAAVPEDQVYASNIFLRDHDGEGRVEDAQSIRERALAGESFANLATEYSDSESRHQGGVIGWVKRGDLSAELEDILFGLEESIPSEPIRTQDGVHLFSVEIVVKSDVPAYEEVKPEIRRALVTERRDAEIERLVNESPTRPQDIDRTFSELTQVLADASEDTVLLRIADFELTVASFKRAVERQRSGLETGDDGSQSLRSVFEQIRQREVLYRRFQSAGHELSPAGQEEVKDQIREYTRNRLIEYVIDDVVATRDEAVREFHARHRRRFMSPLKLRLDVLSVAIGERASDHMGLLESARETLSRSAKEFEQLAVELDTEIQGTEWLDIALLRIRQPRWAFFASRLQPGEYSAPFSNGNQLQMLRVSERQEPQPLEFDQIRSRVTAAYRERHVQSIYREWVADLSRERNAKIDAEIIASYLATTAPKGQAGIEFATGLD